MLERWIFLELSLREMAIVLYIKFTKVLMDSLLLLLS